MRLCGFVDDQQHFETICTSFSSWLRHLSHATQRSANHGSSSWSRTKPALV